MSKSMENNTAAIYLRRSTEDDGRFVVVRSRTEETGHRNHDRPYHYPRTQNQHVLGLSRPDLKLKPVRVLGCPNVYLFTNAATRPKHLTKAMAGCAFAVA